MYRKPEKWQGHRSESESQGSDSRTESRHSRLKKAKAMQKPVKGKDTRLLRYLRGVGSRTCFHSSTTCYTSAHRMHDSVVQRTCDGQRRPCLSRPALLQPTVQIQATCTRQDASKEVYSVTAGRSTLWQQAGYKWQQGSYRVWQQEDQQYDSKGVNRVPARKSTVWQQGGQQWHREIKSDNREVNSVTVGRWTVWQ